MKINGKKSRKEKRKVPEVRHNLFPVSTRGGRPVGKDGALSTGLSPG